MNACPATIATLGNTLGCILGSGHEGGHAWGRLPPPPPDDGDVTCAQADDTPEGAAKQAMALAEISAKALRSRILAVTRSATVDTLNTCGAALRRRIRVAVLAYLRASEHDWQRLWDLNAKYEGAQIVEEAKRLHDAQLAQLFTLIGEAL